MFPFKRINKNRMLSVGILAISNFFCTQHVVLPIFLTDYAQCSFLLERSRTFTIDTTVKTWEVQLCTLYSLIGEEAVVIIGVALLLWEEIKCQLDVESTEEPPPLLLPSPSPSAPLVTGSRGGGCCSNSDSVIGMWCSWCWDEGSRIRLIH